MLTKILLAFIPVFVAVDVIGVLPFFVSLTESFTEKERRKVVFQTMVTAICLAVGFLYLGKFVFRLLNITVGDFMVAGGALLFCIAITDIINPTKKRRAPANEFGAVPMGTPLVVGPAVLTISLIMIDEYGLVPTLISVVANIILAGIVLNFSIKLIKLFGISGARALSKVASLLLAAISVMMIRKGIIYILGK